MFLIPLLIGFTCNSVSAFTAFYSRRWGPRTGQLLSTILRNVLGLPVWVIGLALAIREPAPYLFVPGIAIEVAAWLLILTGCGLMIWALLSIRRQALMPSVQDKLICDGPYGYIRHPIYSGLLLEFLGLMLLQPTPPALLAGAIGLGWTLIQARLEELDLLQRLPAYRQYMDQVPRFVPRQRKRDEV
jgi:protein-S-isoprenylcysteine O-methyltransferase Ste14